MLVPQDNAVKFRLSLQILTLKRALRSDYYVKLNEGRANCTRNNIHIEMKWEILVCHSSNITQIRNSISNCVHETFSKTVYKFSSNSASKSQSIWSLAIAEINPSLSALTNTFPYSLSSLIRKDSLLSLCLPFSPFLCAFPHTFPHIRYPVEANLQTHFRTQRKAFTSSH